MERHKPQNKSMSHKAIHLSPVYSLCYNTQTVVLSESEAYALSQSSLGKKKTLGNRANFFIGYP